MKNSKKIIFQKILNLFFPVRINYAKMFLNFKTIVPNNGTECLETYSF